MWWLHEYDGIPAEFEEFVDVISVMMDRRTRQKDSNDTLQAFIAMGGNTNRTGIVHKQKLKRTCARFGLTIDVDVCEFVLLAMIYVFLINFASDFASTLSLSVCMYSLDPVPFVSPFLMPDTTSPATL